MKKAKERIKTKKFKGESGITLIAFAISRKCVRY